MRTVLLFGVFALAACGQSAACRNEAAAYKGLQPMILQEIVNPAQATFPALQLIRLTAVNKCEFVGKGYVDTKSVAGVPVRVHYTVHTRLDPATHKYQKLSLDFSSGEPDAPL